jgi:hypothetical protein
VKRITEPAAFALLIAIELVESLIRRHWMNRGRVAILTATGLFLAGMVEWLAIGIGLAAGALCARAGTWHLLNPGSMIVAVVGLGIWLFR